MAQDSANLIQVQNLSKAFPGVQALDQVDITLNKGEVLGLMGENGAGKSTFMKILCGVYKRDSGRISYLGQDVTFSRAHEAQVAGIIPVYQELSLCENMTIAENIFIHRQPVKKYGNVIDWKKLYRETEKLLALFKLDVSPGALVADCSVSLRQQVEILKAISFNPKLLILDEPTSSLGQREADLLFQIVERLKEQGIGLIYIAHDVDEVITISDRISVLRDGRHVGTIPSDQASETKLIQMMVGRTIDSLYPEMGQVEDRPVFEVRHLAEENSEQEISFEVHKGEILGIAGLVGSGRSHIAKMIFGLEPRKSGELYVNGQRVKLKNHRDAILQGIAYVPKDRKAQGLFLEMDISRNIVAARLDKYCRHGLMDLRLEQKEAKQYSQLLKIKSSGVDQEVRSLSGGNQQKVLLGKWLSVKPKVLLIDEPTRGIDVVTKSEIHQMIRQLADQGVAIVMISSELPEILGMSDQILVVNDGKVVNKLPNKDASQETIMECISQAIAQKQRVNHGSHS
jgi:ABC-type sugar transport system ATPase subunit